jgi:hypothetical protein
VQGVRGRTQQQNLAEMEEEVHGPDAAKRQDVFGDHDVPPLGDRPLRFADEPMLLDHAEIEVKARAEEGRISWPDP